MDLQGQVGTALVTIDDGDLPGQTAEEKRKVLEYWYEYNLDRYYDKIYPHTFYTVFVQVSVEEARAWQAFNSGRISKDQKHIFTEIEKKLDKAIQDVANKGSDGAFVRLSTRSPKDAVDKFPDRVIPLLRNELHKLADEHHQSVEELDDNAQLIAIRRAFLQTMRVHSAEEAFQLMTLSARTISDLKRALDHAADTDMWDMQLVVREFIDIPSHAEFRGFVYKGQLTAISQYDTHILFPELVENKDEFEKRMKDFFEEIKPHIPSTMESYILDFAVLPDRICIVELNPFCESAGAGHFKWKNKEDKMILEGESEFQFRLTTTSSASNVLAASWRQLLQQAKKQVDEEPEVHKQDKNKKKGDKGNCVVG